MFIEITNLCQMFKIILYLKVFNNIIYYIHYEEKMQFAKKKRLGKFW